MPFGERLRQSSAFEEALKGTCNKFIAAKVLRIISNAQRLCPGHLEIEAWQHETGVEGGVRFQHMGAYCEACKARPYAVRATCNFCHIDLKNNRNRGHLCNLASYIQLVLSI